MNWPSFERKGIDPQNKFFIKLWQVSRALNNVSPFSDEILELNFAQMNFIQRKYAEDHPDEYRIIDESITKGENPSQMLSAWTYVLCGKALEEFSMNPIGYLRKYYNWSKE